LPYLAEHPPTHILVAGLVGLKSRRNGMPPAGSDLAALRQEFGTGDVHAGMRNAAILDFDRLKAASTRSA
jgi:hypothetical protein